MGRRREGDARALGQAQVPRADLGACGAGAGGGVHGARARAADARRLRARGAGATPRACCGGGGSAAQASFDNWLLSASAAAAEPQQQQGAPAVVLPHQQQRPGLLPPFTQFFHLSGPATAAAATNGGAAVVNPSKSNPGACVLTPQNVQMPPTNPASTVLSSTEPIVLASQFVPAAAPTHHRELPVSQAGVSDLAVVGDNFTHDGASTSAAPPPVPRLTPKDLLLQIGLPGRGGPGGAQ